MRARPESRPRTLGAILFMATLLNLASVAQACPSHRSTCIRTFDPGAGWYSICATGRRR